MAAGGPARRRDDIRRRGSGTSYRKVFLSLVLRARFLVAGFVVKLWGKEPGGSCIMSSRKRHESLHVIATISISSNDGSYCQCIMRIMWEFARWGYIYEAYVAL